MHVLRLAVVACLLALAATAPSFAQAPARAVAVFAGGCFWCMEPPFDKLDGVTATISGYTGGHQANPTYEQVSTGGTGHLEAVRVEYDPARVSYEKLLEVFWRNIDPLDAHGQFCDKGEQYLSAIFVADDQQRAAAEASKAALERSGKLPGPIVTRILPAGAFYPAEDYHQDYYRKNPLKYSYYRWGCGRDARLERLWGTVPQE
ncbi:peptide-methionine (S)-S-oxide reductase MsrA [Vineibacter terrae]|uniref:Peptide methionine sulfoxide reductase MsrA n=1 Tax=Vineibacter terrae TaxID=2586908 RepID=A0A5C8P7K3_9HYPH|nr:peptide-methionine (S)-S-oxide reductase MsrA [Vineibacter terrae]TXL69410.1 peptide-methionine (S)-S-oxide reductase MsrA [Vineibacter terrae]